MLTTQNYKYKTANHQTVRGVSDSDCSNNSIDETDKGGGRRFGMGGKPTGVWGRESTSGVQGRSPCRGSGGLRSPDPLPGLKIFKSSYKQILRVFW